MAGKKGGLGRGLGALLGDLDSKPISIFEDKEEAKSIDEEKPAVKAKKNKSVEKVEKVEKSAKADKTEKPEEGVFYIALDDIKPNSKQPRRVFNEEALNELADSIKQYGVIQPVLVRKFSGGYELVAGERRWRAARKAGLKKIPAIIREFDEQQNALVALLENMQREDLNMIEEAQGIQALMNDFGLSQEEAAKAVGKSRPYVANAIRLLKLPKEVQSMVEEGVLSAGHAKAIAGVLGKEAQLKLAQRAVKEGWTVRKIESESSRSVNKKSSKKKKQKDENISLVEEELSQSLGTKVVINGSEIKGKIELSYFSRDELERLVELLGEK